MYSKAVDYKKHEYQGTGSLRAISEHSITEVDTFWRMKS